MADKKNKGGRPKTDYTEQKKIILEEMAKGQSLRSICKAEGMPDRITIFRLCNDDDEFCNQYMRARKFQADCYSDLILEKAETLLDRAKAGETKPHEVSATSIFIDTHKWTAARMAPRKYGKHADEIEHNDIEAEKSDKKNRRLLDDMF